MGAIITKSPLHGCNRAEGKCVEASAKTPTTYFKARRDFNEIEERGTHSLRFETDAIALVGPVVAFDSASDARGDELHLGVLQKLSHSPCA